MTRMEPEIMDRGKCTLTVIGRDAHMYTIESRITAINPCKIESV